MERVVVSVVGCTMVAKFPKTPNNPWNIRNAAEESAAFIVIKPLLAYCNVVNDIMELPYALW